MAQQFEEVVINALTQLQDLMVDYRTRSILENNDALRIASTDIFTHSGALILDIQNLGKINEERRASGHSTSRTENRA